MASIRAAHAIPEPITALLLRWIHAKAVRRTLLGAVLALALVLRMVDLGHLSLWLDELATVSFSQLSWSTVSGLNGAYDNHPPLYYLLAKVAAIFVPDEIAGRLISAIAGTCTIAVLFAIVRTIASYQAALLSAFCLTIAPLHIWYSREGRMYALVALFVALVVLMVVLNWRDDRRIWAVGAGAFATLAMYSDYSAAFALIPLGVVVLWQARKAWSVRWPVLLAFVLASVAYIPWVGQITRTIDDLQADRSFLTLTPHHFIASVLAVIGLGGKDAYYWGAAPTPVSQWPLLGSVVLVALIPVLLALLLTLPRQASAATLLVLALFPGVLVTAAAASLISPAFADRTVLTAVIGWSILIGIVPSLHLPCGSRLLTGGALAGLLVLSLATTSVVAWSGDKQDYRAYASQLDAASDMNIPVIVPDGWTRTALAIYAPTLIPQRPDDPLVTPTVWLAGGPFDNLESVRGVLSGQGYGQLSTQTLDTLDLELWALPDVVTGSPIPGDQLAIRANRAADGSAWRVSGSGITTEVSAVAPPNVLVPEPVVIQALDGATNESTARASLDLVAEPDTLYIGTVNAASLTGQTTGVLEVTCHSQSGSGLVTTRAEQIPGTAELETAVLCPRATVALSLSVSDAGSGSIRFSDPAIRVVRVADPPPEP